MASTNFGMEYDTAITDAEIAVEAYKEAIQRAKEKNPIRYGR